MQIPDAPWIREADRGGKRQIGGRLMRKYFEDDEETIERWKFGAAFVVVGAAWWVILALSFGII